MKAVAERPHRASLWLHTHPLTLTLTLALPLPLTPTLALPLPLTLTLALMSCGQQTDTSRCVLGLAYPPLCNAQAPRAVAGRIPPNLSVNPTPNLSLRLGSGLG